MTMIGQTLGRYEILSLLGVGGMGEVYLAYDTQLGRNVALKLLPSAFADDEQRLNRFAREARAASTLNHPGIVTIHEIGKDRDWSFIATEFVEGETLRQRMVREPIPLGEALDMTSQVASALAASHAAGIVHRDIKPENLMVRADGYVKVLDFGLAKLTWAPAEPDAATVGGATEAGMVMGTVRYMAPEQARGLTVDARADLFSLGAVFYELVTGRPAFQGKTNGDVMVAVLEKQAPPLSRYLPDVPSELERIVTKALRKSPDERYQTARDFNLDLKAFAKTIDVGGESPGGAAAKTFPNAWSPVIGLKRYRFAAAAIAAALVIGVAAAFWRPAEEAIDSVAILPFENLTKDPGTDYLSEGISDSVITRLKQALPDLRVLSINSVLRYKGRQTEATVIGRELNARAVLTGRITRVGERLSFSVELVDARDGAHIWGEQYQNRREDGLIEVQEEIARDISLKLRLRLSIDERQRLARRDTNDPRAYNLYLRGRVHWNKFTAADLRKSIDYFRQAAAMDPEYALAYSGMADSYSLLGELSYAPPREAFLEARIYADKALTLDDSLAEAHVSRALVKLYFEWDWQGAEDALRRAQQLAPTSVDVHHFLGHYMQITGRTADGVTETRRSVDLEPTNLLVASELAWAYVLDGQYEEAIAQCRRVLAADETFYYGSWVMAQAYERLGRYREAASALNRVRAPSGEWVYILGELAYVEAKMGNRAAARNLANLLIQRSATEYVDKFLIAQVFAALREPDEAFQWLQKAEEERSGLMAWLQVEPHVELLRSDPRLDALATRMKLPQTR